jgi:hypothetical protein
MALSLDAIYKPLNEFFTQKFAADGAPAKFRFARVPRAFADSDFVLPIQPDAGPSLAVAAEVFSIVVDRIMQLDADGQTVWQGISRISDLYGDEILDPSIPFVPPEVTDDTERQADIDAFVSTKADAVRLQNNRSASVLQGAEVQFHPSSPEPASWWDRTNEGLWTHQSFDVQGAVSAPSTGTPVPPNLLRMKVSDAALSTILNVDKPPPPPGAPTFRLPPSAIERFATLEPAAAPERQVMMRAQIPIARRAIWAGLGSRIGGGVIAAEEPAPPPPPAPAANSFNQHDQLIRILRAAPITERLDVESVLVQDAPHQPVTTNNATISFSYCVVTVDRNWFHEAFIRNPFWRVPGQPKGQLSANDGHGLPVLPVGFVAIKDLSIKAPWTPEDISNLEQSVQFGPFNFDSTVVDGAIGHAGIQIVGWMLQDLPDLPPN